MDEKTVFSSRRGKPENAISTFSAFCLGAIVIGFSIYGCGGRRAIPLKEIDTKNAETHYQAGYQLRSKGKFQAAKVEYREAIRLNPNHVDALNSLGWASFYTDSLEEATREFKKAIYIKSSLYSPHLGLGLIYKNTKKWRESEKELRLAISLWPYYYLPDCSGDFKRALSYTQTNPVYRQTASDLSAVLAKQGEQAESKVWSDSADAMQRRQHHPRGDGVGERQVSLYQGHVSVRVVGFSKDGLLFRSLPQIKDTAKIEYPPIGRTAGIAGTTRLILSLDRKGEVVKTQIAHSSGNEALDVAAKGVSKTKFSPPRLKKKAKNKTISTCDLIVDVEFILEKKK